MEIQNNQKFSTKGSRAVMARFAAIVLTIVCLSMTFAGCSTAEDKAAAETVMSDYYAQIKDKNYGSIPQMCSDEFFEKTSRIDFMHMLKSINNKLGDLQSYSLEDWKITNHYGTTNSGTYYYLTYKVEYSKYTAEEQFTLYKTKGTDDILILSYNIKSDGLFKE